MKQATNICQIKKADNFQLLLIFSWQVALSPGYIQSADKHMNKLMSHSQETLNFNLNTATCKLILSSRELRCVHF